MIDVIRVMALSLVDGRMTSTNQIVRLIGSGTMIRKVLSLPTLRQTDDQPRVVRLRDRDSG